ncbi:MAG: FecR family protein, partial [Actinomycetota bacterium]|nr:FecR family protein [Actinomycetota bacterium]
MPAGCLLKKIAIAVSVVLLAATAFALVSADGGLGEMTLKRLRGDVSVLRAGEVIDVSGESSIEPGDRITTGRAGRAELRLEGLRRVELAPDSMVIVAGTSAVEGRRGSLLASSGRTDAISVGFGQVEGTTTGGMFRVDLGAGSSRLGVYEGGAVISSPGQSDASVDRYFQASVAGNDRALEPTPLILEREDAWDR